MGSLCACWVLLLASFCQRHAVNAEYWRVRDLIRTQEPGSGGSQTLPAETGVKQWVCAPTAQAADNICIVH
ncbi:hypothetical protein B484DRAFT_30920 [Ochromonadaceae sp. CCMP2298]|nr:hypothetical protein B484DRAFT_30920 [Ochromonadaceae sp. CCMP2298]